MVLIRLGLAISLIAAIFGPAIAGVYLPITSFGWVVSSLLLPIFFVLCLLTPDIVYSQRSQVSLGLGKLIGMRLKIRPVWEFIRTNSVTSKAPDHLAAKALIGHLFMATIGMGVIGFFFYVTAGFEYLDVAFVQRDWQETEATIDSQSSEGGYKNSYYIYNFNYRVEEDWRQASCYGADQLDEDSELVALYDKRQPAVAVLKGHLRVKDLPFAPFVLGCISLVIFLPLPILLGHLFAALVFGPANRHRRAF